MNLVSQSIEDKQTKSYISNRDSDLVRQYTNENETKQAKETRP